MLPSTALLHPVQRPDPLFWLDSTKVVLLAMQIGGDIMAHESEKGRNGKGFVAVAHDTVVDGMFMEVDAEPCDERIDRNHQQDSDNTAIAKKPVSQGPLPESMNIKSTTYCRCSIGLL